MTSHNDFLDIAIQFHEALPKRIREYLNARGIPDDIVNSHLLGWNGWRITIPIYNRQGSVVFFKLAKDPEDSRPAPKMLTSRGTTVELYGWDRLVAQPDEIIVCEGEFDRLVLEAQGFAAVTSTGGAACFRPEWAKELNQIGRVYVCFDRDQAGRNGAAVVGLMVPGARLVELPEEVGDGGDVTDFFARLGGSREQFLRLLEAATPVPANAVSAGRTCRSIGPQSLSSLLNSRIDRIKRQVPIDVLVRRYVELKSTALGATLIGRCPFHDDRNPSFTVYPQSGTYHCFACRAHGDVISFTQAMDHLAFGDALERLEQMTSHDEQDARLNHQQDQAA